MIEVLRAVGDSLLEAFFMFWETLWALILGFGLSGVVQAFVSRGRMERVLGRPGAGSVARATFLGMVSSSCSYAASAMAKSIFQKGADFTAALVFMIASTNLVIELGIVLALLLGWQFTASEFAGGLLMIALFALASRFLLPRALVEQARSRLRGGDARSGHGAHADAGGPQAGMRTLAGWADAASYTIADLTMLRREMVIGFTVAGFLAMLVPASVWNGIFLSGNGFWTSLENAIVGPFIAIISFVCSIGNVPLAAALWHGGISFGGVVAFVFADLITFPLLLIYRKYYGTKLTLWILGVFWAVMSLGGLVIELVFDAAGLVPSTRPATIAPERFQWNYTTVLNIVFLSLFAVLYWLHRNRARFGGGAGYAIDPVCGMQVQTATAPASARHQGTTFHFCSDHCRERFEADPDRYARRRGVKEEMTMGEKTEQAIDPVCGMTVDPATAAAHRTHEGREYHFCAQGCAEKFDRDPERHLAGARSAMGAAVDPVCGMDVDPATAAAVRRHEGRNVFFCSEGCAEAFDREPARYAGSAAQRG